MARARYDQSKFTFDVRDDGTRLVYRPDEVLVRHGGDADLLRDVFGAVGRQPRIAVEGRNPVPDLAIDDNWGVIRLPLGQDPREVVAQLRADGINAQLNHVYFVGSLAASASVARNAAVPNYAVPNYAVPNYAVPNYAVPNYAVPNYAVPNYAVPNYAVPNYAVPNDAVGRPGFGCACNACDEGPGREPDVPFITARAARVPHQALPPVDVNVEIHVLDVRPQTTANEILIDSDVFVAGVKADQPDTRPQLLIDKPGALIPEALFLADEFATPSEPEDTPQPDENELTEDELRASYLEEPSSDGLGSNVNLDNYVDPTTNHGVFIKGIIDRLLPPAESDSYVTLHSVIGTLGDVSDAELVKAMNFVSIHSSDPGKHRIMSLSIAGYPDLDDEATDCLAEATAQLQSEGWLIVASAGNDGSCRPTRPASLDGVVSVAAYGPAGPAWFSNYGSWVDACAPGVGVVSDFPKPEKAGLEVDGFTEADAEFTTGYASWSGTSFAAPFVAAMLARSLTGPDIDSLQAAVDELILDPGAVAHPGYGTIVSFQTERVNTSWI